MDFPEFYLNEPYVITPYKICVASYFVGYLQEYYVELEQKNGPSKMLNGQMVFKLINSIDLSFKDLRNLLATQKMKAVGSDLDVHGKFAGKLKTRFDKWVKEIQSSEIGLLRFDDCITAITMATTPLDSRKTASMKSPFANMVDIDRNSLMGLFLRKLRVHFDRLAYSELNSLWSQLVNYFAVDDEADYIKHKKNTKQKGSTAAAIERHHQWLEFVKNQVANINIGLFEHCLLSVSDEFDPCLKFYITKMFKQVKKLLEERQKLYSATSPKKEKSITEPHNADVDIEDVSMDLTANSNETLYEDMEIDMDISVNSADTSNAPENLVTSSSPTLNDAISMDTEQSENNSTKFSTLTMQSYEENSNNISSQYASEHFIVSQLQKVITNEMEALPPDELFRLIALYFEKFTPYQYHRFIKLNYFANLSMLREFSTSNGNQIVDRAGRDSLGNVNMIHGPGGVSGGAGANASSGSSGIRNIGLGDLAGGVFSLSAAAHAGALRKIDGVTKKAKDLFQAINFHRFDFRLSCKQIILHKFICF